MASERETVTPSRIVGGIETYTYSVAGEEHEGLQCARCGSSVDSIECSRCGGEGGYFGEEIASSYDYGWIDEDRWYTCDSCHGRAVSYHCLSSPEWCEANPLPGRENIVSTALSAQAWSD